MNVMAADLTILLVEDSKEDALLFRLAFAKAGIAGKLLFAPNGKVAIEMLSQPEQPWRPDIIFLDLKMPMISGFEVLRWIQLQNFQSRLHVVVLSGSPHEEDRTLALELGASDYVVKPIAIDDLRHRLFPLSDKSISQP